MKEFVFSPEVYTGGEDCVDPEFAQYFDKGDGAEFCQLNDFWILGFWEGNE